MRRKTNDHLHEKEFVEIGFISKAHGHKGEVKAVIKETFIDDFFNQQFVFILIDGYRVPFHVQEAYEAKTIVVKFADINSPDDVGLIRGANVYLLKGDIQEAEAHLLQEEKLKEWEGLIIVDENTGPIGRIDHVEEYPQQLMAIVIDQKGKEIMIPLHPDLIVERKRDQLIMSLPEGLV